MSEPNPPQSPHWQPLSPSKSMHVDWNTVVHDERPIDPYLIWADQTDFAGYSGPEGKRFDPKEDALPIAVEVKNLYECVPAGVRIEQPREGCSPEFGLLDIPGAYKTRVIEGSGPDAMLVTRFFTASIMACNVGQLLRTSEKIVRFQLGIPRIPDVSREAIALSSGAGRGRDRVVVGIIDDGFGFAHPNFLNKAGQPRTVYLWDQDGERKPCVVNGVTWRKPQDLGYGAELYWADLRQAVDAGKVDEAKAYVQADYLPHAPEPDRHATSLKAVDGRPVPPGTMLTHAHGTAVLHLSAGRMPALTRVSASQGPLPTSDADDDQAGAWPLVLVQLPTRTTLDTTGGSLAVHILDGIRYILRRAETIPPEEVESTGTGFNPNDFQLPDTPPLEPGKPGGTYFPSNRVVINISYGAVGGAHDGTSIVEQAIAELVGGQDPARGKDRPGDKNPEGGKESEGDTYPLRPGTWVVLAAGNSHQSRTHARLALTEGAGPKSLVWSIGPDNLLESYLEIWLPEVVQPGKAGEEAKFVCVDDLLKCILVTVQPPAGLPLQTVQNCGGFLLIDPRTHRPMASAILARRVAQGTKGTMLLLTVARTQRPLPGDGPSGPVTVAPHGDWTVELSIAAGSKVGAPRTWIVHAWAERNDQLWGNVRRQQSTVVGDDPVPEPTEFAPSVIAACARGIHPDSADAPRPFQPDMSMSSLASITPPKDFATVEPVGTTEEGIRAGSRSQGGAVVVGGYRLSDHEVPAYSASGPVRASRADTQPVSGGVCNSLGFEARGDERLGPDYSAPSDQGVAVRGLRTRGLLSSSVSRLSGTSAAAPLATRFLAGRAHAALLADLKDDQGLRPVVMQAEAARDQQTGKARDTAGLTDDEARQANSRRTTPTPTRDDRFRLGNQRIVPAPPQK